MKVLTERLQIVGPDNLNDDSLLWKVYLEEKEIGFISFTRIEKRFKIYFEIKNEYRDLGYATEALKGVLKKFNIEYFKPKIFCFVDENNPACARVLIKSGFKYCDDEFIN